MEVANDRNADDLLVELLDDMGYSCCGVIVVDGYANQFGTASNQSRHKLHRRGKVRRVSVGHRLHYNWCIRPYAHASDNGRNGLSTWDVCHMGNSILSSEKRPTADSSESVLRPY